jgi:hypothetical protein
MREIYKGGPTFGVSLTKRVSHFILSGAVDYRLYQPIQASFPIELEFLGETTTIGTLTFSNFTGIGASVGGAYETSITPSASFYIGLNGGFIFSSHSLTVESDIDIQTETIKSNIPYIGPKIGLNFAVTNAINIGVEARYNLGLSKNNYNITTIDSPPDSFKSYAGNLFLTYNF